MGRRKNLNDKFGFVDSMKIKDFIDYEQPNGYIVESDRYNSKYSTPVLTAGQSFILGYTNESKGVYEKGPCIIFDDFTTSVHYVDFPFKVKSSAMKILTTKSNADIKYCYYLLLSLSKMPPNHKRQWISTTSEKSYVLPSMDKQISIVKQLDLISDTIANYTNQIENLDNLVKARFIEMFGDPYTNPLKWEKLKIKDAVTVEPQNGLYKPQSDYVTDRSGIPILRIDGFYDGIVTDFASLKRLKCSETEKQKYLLLEDDIVINRVNSIEYLGKCAHIKGLLEDTVYESNMMRMHFDPETYNSAYICKLLCSQFIYDQIVNHAKKAVNQASINQKDVLDFNIYQPPIDLQNQFSGFVRQVDKSREAVKKSLEKTQQLYDSLMQEYFG